MIHKITVDDDTKEGKLVLDMINAMKVSKKAVKVQSPDFSMERLVLGFGPPLTDDEMEILAQESEKSKGVSLNTLRKKLQKKSVAAHASRGKKAS
jgi:hypothetical protein